jgi:hypothetical protein
MEVEVPQVAHQPDVLPVADPRQEGIHQDHALLAWGNCAAYA